MKILHVTPSYFPATRGGGPVYTVYALNNALSCYPNIKLKILTTDSAGTRVDNRLDLLNLDRSIYPNQELIFTRNEGKWNISSGMLVKLPGLIKWADIVNLTATYSFPTIPTLFLCRLMNKPVVWSHHGAILEAYEWENARNKHWKRIWERFCNVLIQPGRVIAHVTSESEKEAAELRIPKAKAVIVSNGVDITKQLPVRVWQPGGNLRLMFIGRISRKKGIENLLHALRKMEDPNISLTLYGAGQKEYEESVKRLANELAFPKGQVSFVGHVDGEDRERAFYNADVCVVPSYSENFGMVVAEALVRGVPVVTSHATPWQEVEERQCGLWVDNSPESLIQAIIRIRSMPLKDMGQRGREWMINSYSWDAIAQEMITVYESLLQGYEV